MANTPRESAPERRALLSTNRSRYWDGRAAIASVTHKHFEKGPTFALEDLLVLKLHEHVEGVMEVVEVANKELKVEAKLKAIEEGWSTMKLEFTRHRDTEVFVPVPSDELLETLEEHQMQLQAMVGMGAGVAILNEGVLAFVMLQHLGEQTVEMGLGNRPVDVAPPDILLGGGFFDDEAVVGRTPGVLPRFGDDGATGRQLAFAAANGFFEQVVGFKVPVGPLDARQSVVFQSEAGNEVSCVLHVLLLQDVVRA